MKKNGKTLVKILAALAVVAGGVVAAVAFVRRKAKKLGEELDYDGDLYFSDDDYNDENDYNVSSENNDSEQKASDDSEDDIDPFDAAVDEEETEDGKSPYAG